MPNQYSGNRVVITGLGAVTPLGHEVDTFWKNILEGQWGIDRITLFDVSAYDCQIAGEVKDFDPVPSFPSPKEVRRTGRIA